MYNSNKPQTKQNKTFENVVNVVSLCDNDGSPIIYAINFDDGFILVSATKKYFPILAEVEHGTFNLNSTAAYDILLNDYIDDIKYFNNQPQLEAIKEAWSIYENYSSPLMQTKSSINDDYYDLLNEYVNIWESEGYNYYYLRQKPENLPDDVYDYYCELAAEYDMNGYNYLDCSIIVENIYEGQMVQHGPYLNTEWNQHAPYNSKVENNLPLGCATVASGQIMYYFNRPTNWNNVPANVKNDSIYNFLADLREKLEVKDNGNTLGSKVVAEFNKHNYNTSKEAHNLTMVYSSLNRKYPVFMEGTDSTGGHGWVCDGYRTFTDPYREYTLYVVLKSSNGDLSFVEEAYDIYYSASVTPDMFHMNWGWQNNNVNGYFLDSDLRVSRDGQTTNNYCSDRYDIIIPLNTSLFGIL